MGPIWTLCQQKTKVKAKLHVSWPACVSPSPVHQTFVSLQTQGPMPGALQCGRKGRRATECSPEFWCCSSGTIQSSHFISQQPYTVGFANFKDEEFNMSVSSSALLNRGWPNAHLQESGSAVHGPRTDSLCLHDQSLALSWARRTSSSVSSAHAGAWRLVSIHCWVRGGAEKFW